MLFSSLWAIVIIDDFEPIQNFKRWLWKINGDYKFNNFIIKKILRKLFTCNMCFSYWLFSFAYLFIYSSGMGFIYGVVVYFLTFLISKWYHKIKI